VILGMMSYGDPKWQEWVLDEEQSLPLLEHAYKVGINTWDTVGQRLLVSSLPSRIHNISSLVVVILARKLR
jgi:hypothetical protein